MPRWSLRLRDKYAPDEPGPGEFFDQAADALFGELEARRQEENQMAMAGAERIPGPGVKDRIQGVRDAWNNRPRWLGGRAPQPTRPRLIDEDLGRPDVGMMQTSEANAQTPEYPIGLTPSTRRTSGFPYQTPDFNPNARSGAGVWGTGDTPDFGQRLPRVTVQGTPDPVRQQGAPPPAPRPTIGTRIDQAMGGDEFKPITLKGRGGDRYQIDPLREQKMKMAGTRMESDYEDTIAERNIHRQVEAAVRAGMSRDEAEVRARTNTWRYDEEFGRPAGSSGLSPEEFTRREELKQAHRIAMQNLRNAQQQRNRASIERNTRVLATIEAELRGIDAAGRIADDLAPTNPRDRRMMGRDSTGAAGVRRGDSIREEQTRRLTDIQQRLDSIAQGRPRTPPRTRTDTPADPTSNPIPRPRARPAPKANVKQQRKDWDNAASWLRARGRDPVKELGKRP